MAQPTIQESISELGKWAVAQGRSPIDNKLGNVLLNITLAGNNKAGIQGQFSEPERETLLSAWESIVKAQNRPGKPDRNVLRHMEVVLNWMGENSLVNEYQRGRASVQLKALNALANSPSQDKTTRKEPAVDFGAPTAVATPRVTGCEGRFLQRSADEADESEEKKGLFEFNPKGGPSRRN